MSQFRQAANAFVGRERELTELKVALNAALSGRGQLVMLAGEPGVGKTRTVQELAAYAQGQGVRTLWGWCYEEEGAPSFWPWVQPIRTYVEEADPERLRLEMGVGASEIAQIVPEIRTKLLDLELTVGLDLQQGRFRLFDSTTRFLENSARSQPFMLVLDDLHWADKPSLMLLQFLARRLSECNLLVVGCYRDVELSRQHPLFETLADLSRQPAFRRLSIRGLNQDDARVFIEETTGIRLPRELVAEIHSRTDGNPFFLKEVVSLLVERGDLRAGPLGRVQSISIPLAVREAIGQRLNRRSERCNQVLSKACVIGREFGLDLLQRLNEGSSEDYLLEALEEALAAGVIEEVYDSTGRYRFSHALMQESMASEISAARRAGLHARIGQILEEIYGAGVQSHAAELAFHWGEGKSVSGPAKVVVYSQMAGEQALENYAYEEASVYFQRALAAKDPHEDDSQTAALLFGQGRSQAALLLRAEARDSLVRAFDYYAGVGDVFRALNIVENLPPGSQLLGMNELTERALDWVPAGSLQAGRLLSRLGFELGRGEGDYEGSQDAFQKALSIARQQGDQALEMRTLAQMADVEAHNLDFQASLDNALNAIEISAAGKDLYAESLARYQATSSLLCLGELGNAGQYVSSGLVASGRLRDRFRLRNALLLAQSAAGAAGDWEGARAYSDRALEAAHDDVLVLSLRSFLECECGTPEQVMVYISPLLEAMAKHTPRSTIEDVMPAVLVALVSDLLNQSVGLNTAEGAANEVLSAGNSPPLQVLMARQTLGLVAHIRDDVAEASRQYAELRSDGGVLLHWGIASLDRVLGKLAQTTGQFEQASHHFEDSLAFCRKAGCGPELALTCYDYAGALTKTGRTAERAKAIPLLDEALYLTQELGMGILRGRVAELRDGIRGPGKAVAGHPDRLTQREVDVLKLVATGKTNQEISEELIISSSTVAHHITNILNKIGATNRTEAAAYAAQHRLLTT